MRNTGDTGNLGNFAATPRKHKEWAETGAQHKRRVGFWSQEKLRGVRLNSPPPTALIKEGFPLLETILSRATSTSPATEHTAQAGTQLRDLFYEKVHRGCSHLLLWTFWERSAHVISEQVLAEKEEWKPRRSNQLIFCSTRRAGRPQHLCLCRKKFYLPELSFLF